VAGKGALSWWEHDMLVEGLIWEFSGEDDEDPVDLASLITMDRG